MQLGVCTPILRMFDPVKAAEFYVQFLGFKIARPAIENTPWGTKEMDVIDPFHNRLVFFERQS